MNAYQVAMDSGGRLYIATYGPDYTSWEVLPLVGVGALRYDPIPCDEWVAPRPHWAVDFYSTDFAALADVCETN